MGEAPDPMKRTEGERESTSRARTRDSADDATVAFDAVEIVGVDEEDDMADDAGASAGTGDSDSTHAIRNDIEQTRAQMSGTIDEITERLNPKRLMDEAKETVRDATVGKVTGMMSDASRSAGGVVDRIKENPMTAAMIGAGAWWLLTRLPESGRSSSSYARNYGTSRASGGSGRESYGRGSYAGGSYGNESYGNAGYGNDSYAGGSYGSASGTLGRDRGRSSGRMGESGGIGDMARSATEAVGDYTSRGREQVSEFADETQRTFDRWIRENPFAVGAAAIAVGAAIGAAIPETRRERELIGETRDRLIDKAQEMATHTVEQVASAMPGAGNSGTSGESGKGGNSGGAGTGGSDSGDRGGSGSATPGNS